jgi:polysaccharide pyruvyl transferase CsaB
VKRVIVLGYYGAGNLGDEALLSGTLTLLRRVPGLEPWVVSRDPRGTSQRHGTPSIAWNDPTALRRAVGAADALLLGGGGLLQDATSLRSLLYYAGWAWLFGRRLPVVWWAVGVGPLRSAAASRALRTAGARAIAITVRDDQSRRLLEAIGLPVRAVIPDPAFLLPSPPSAGDEGAVVVCARDVPDEPSALAWLASELVALAERTGRAIWLLPLHRGADEAICQRLAARVPGARRLPWPASPEAALAVLGQASVVVSVRLHGLILGAVARRPLVAVPYDPKVEVHAHMLGQPVVRPGGPLADRTLERLGGAGPDPEPFRRRVEEGFWGVVRPVIDG